MTFKILHQFISEEGILRNIRVLQNKNKNKDEDEVWKWIPFGFDPIQLHYKSGGGNTRKFDEGNVTFDHLGATFSYYGKSYRLNRTK
jgi:hypothetical protein